jgi:hypothetical protein
MRRTLFTLTLLLALFCLLDTAVALRHWAVARDVGRMGTAGELGRAPWMRYVDHKRTSETLALYLTGGILNTRFGGDSGVLRVEFDAAGRVRARRLLAGQAEISAEKLWRNVAFLVFVGAMGAAVGHGRLWGRVRRGTRWALLVLLAGLCGYWGLYALLDVMQVDEWVLVWLGKAGP